MGIRLHRRPPPEPWGANHGSPVDYRMGIAAIIALAAVAAIVFSAQ
jgi:hypothetical protein